MIIQLKSRQVDYTQAFPQAELADPVFMRPPNVGLLMQAEIRHHPLTPIIMTRNTSSNYTAIYMAVNKPLTIGTII
jgi:hypothetical protein